MGEVNPIFLGGTGELGRGLEYLKTLQPELRAARMYDNIFRELGSEFLHQGNDAAVSAAMGRLTLMTAEAQKKLVQEAAKDNAPGVLHRFFKQLIFANPGTHFVNIFGNKLSILANSAERTGSSFVLGGPPLAESAANWAGWASGLRSLPTIMRKAAERSTDDVMKAGVNVPVARYSPLGLLGLEDDIMGSWAEVGLTRAEAMKRVINAGVEGKAARIAAVDAMLGDPKTYSELADAVGPEVEHVLFHDPLSGTGEKIASAIRQSKFDYWMPVVKFPINSLKMARDWTPGLQYLSTRTADALIAGGEAEARFRARQTISWMMANIIWDGALEEKIGWGGPR